MSRNVSNVSSAEFRRQQLVQKRLRQVGRLDAGQTLHPSHEIFARQADAVACLEKLVQTGDFKAPQIGVFAQEIGEGGIRNFFVDTYAGFALNNAPELNPELFPSASRSQEKGPTKACSTQSLPIANACPTKAGSLHHLYEVILDERPCWLYFDLEFSRVSNPGRDPSDVMIAFQQLLALFFRQRLGMVLDLSSMLELDASTAEKFSKHIIVQRFGGINREAAASELERNAPEDDSPYCQAFKNNAQVGLLVGEFVAFARSAQEGDQAPLAQLLFAHAPPAAKRDAGKTVSVVDESVYSRNRCFRLSFHKKFGKQAALQLTKDSITKAFGGTSEIPPLQLLRTMVSFVPEDIPFFEHEMIPKDFRHQQLKSARLSSAVDNKCNTTRGSSRGCTSEAVVSDALLQFLVDKWDEMRQFNEPFFTKPERVTMVQSIFTIDDRYFTVTLAHNRFCFCKGTSHVSNSVYVVVDRLENKFCQKCHDPDCRSFRSMDFFIPTWLIETKEESDFWDALPDILDAESKMTQESKKQNAGKEVCEKDNVAESTQEAIIARQSMQVSQKPLEICRSQGDIMTQPTPLRADGKKRKHSTLSSSTSSSSSSSSSTSSKSRF